MSSKAIYNDIKMFKQQYDAALVRQGGVAIAKERLTNVLLTYIDEILAAVEEADSLRKKVAECEEELDAMNKLIIEMSAKPIDKSDKPDKPDKPDKKK